MNEINNPHDKFFKKVFSSKSNAEEFLLNYLPSNVADHLNLKSLEYTKESFVEEHLAAFHILRYMVKIWELWLKEKLGHRFPIIIPMIAYHGENQWEIKLNYSG